MLALRAHVKLIFEPSHGLFLGGLLTRLQLIEVRYQLLSIIPRKLDNGLAGLFFHSEVCKSVVGERHFCAESDDVLVGMSHSRQNDRSLQCCCRALAVAAVQFRCHELNHGKPIMGRIDLHLRPSWREL